MRRLSNRFVTTLFAITLPALGAAGCGSTSTASSLTTTTAPIQITEAFSGTLAVKGGTTFTFAAAGSGSVTAMLKTVSPDSTVLLGLALGTWNGTSCQVVIANDAAAANVTITGAASAAGNLCVRAYDIGKLTQTENIEVTVTHF
jgi:hypothetical protein